MRKGAIGFIIRKKDGERVDHEKERCGESSL